jgi:hypothetical protein
VCDARQAGKAMAMSAAAPRSATTPAMVAPSSGVTPYSNPRSVRVTATAPASPSAAPSAVSNAAIAAHAVASGAKLLTANLDHLARVPGLQIEDRTP